MAMTRALALQYSEPKLLIVFRKVIIETDKDYPSYFSLSDFRSYKATLLQIAPFRVYLKAVASSMIIETFSLCSSFKRTLTKSKIISH